MGAFVNELLEVLGAHHWLLVFLLLPYLGIALLWLDVKREHRKQLQAQAESDVKNANLVTSIQSAASAERSKQLQVLERLQLLVKSAEMDRLQDAKLMADKLIGAISLSHSTTEDLVVVLERLIDATNKHHASTTAPPKH